MQSFLFALLPPSNREVLTSVIIFENLLLYHFHVSIPMTPIESIIHVIKLDPNPVLGHSCYR